MQRTMWMLLLALQLPEGDPVRSKAVDELSARLADQYQSAREDEEARAETLSDE